MDFTIAEVDWATRQRDLLRVRYTVFVNEQGVPVELEHDEHDEEALHLLASDDKAQPIGTVRLLESGHIGRMAVLPAFRRSGVGTALLHDILEVSRRRGHAEVFLHAQCQALPFYRRLGFRAVGDVFVDAGIDHCQMVLDLDTKH